MRCRSVSPSRQTKKQTLCRSKLRLSKPILFIHYKQLSILQGEKKKSRDGFLLIGKQLSLSSIEVCCYFDYKIHSTCHTAGLEVILNVTQTILLTLQNNLTQSNLKTISLTILKHHQNRRPVGQLDRSHSASRWAKVKSLK